MDADPARLVALLPPSTLDVAMAWRPGNADVATVTRELVLPLVIEPDWPGPAAPLPVGDGWVQADLTDDDVDTFDRLRSTLRDAGPEELATAAQAWRLPVVPYRRQDPRLRKPEAAGGEMGTVDLSGMEVVDLSSLWAGPLCTRMLADAGAHVTKIDADCRPDGFRERPNLYCELNRGKTIVDLDLRQPEARVRFEALVSRADLLVESFSRRVLPNLGYGRSRLLELNPRLATLSIVGFPLGSAEQDWLTYGSGIHAISGLGLLDGRARPAPVAYPDPLTGYRAFAAAVELARTPGHIEVALVDAGAAVAGEQHR